MAASKKIDELYDLIKGIETAMFTTRRPTGQLVSRRRELRQGAGEEIVQFAFELRHDGKTRAHHRLSTRNYA